MLAEQMAKMSLVVIVIQFHHENNTPFSAFYKANAYEP